MRNAHSAGRGEEFGASFLKTTQLKSPRLCPFAHPTDTQRGQIWLQDRVGLPVTTRKKADICDSGTPPLLHPAGSPALSTCQFLTGASPSEPWTEVKQSHHNYDRASCLEQLADWDWWGCNPVGEVGEEAPGFPLPHLLSRGLCWAQLEPQPPLPPALEGRGSGLSTAPSTRPNHWTPSLVLPPSHRPPHPPQPPRNPGTEREEPGEGKQALSSRAGWQRPGAETPAWRWGLPATRGLEEKLDPERGGEGWGGGRGECGCSGSSFARWGTAGTAADERLPTQSGPGAPSPYLPSVWGSFSPVSPLVLLPKPLTRVSLPTFLNLLCQRVSPG